MKKHYLLIFAALIFSISFLNAQVTLTQSTTTNITPANTVSCNSGDPNYTTADNIFYRSWDLTALGYSQFDVTEVQFGVESVLNESPGFAVDVIIYSNTGGSFPAGTLTPITTVSVPLVATDTGTLKIIPIVASVMAPAELVFGISIPDEFNAGNITECFLGSNNDGQSAPTYILSLECVIPTPIDYADVTSPATSLVASVTGDAVLSLSDVELSSKVSISPNPTSNVVNIELHPSNSVKSIQLYNITGQLIYKGQNETQISMINYNSGVYLLEITTKNGFATKRIVKQ